MLEADAGYLEKASLKSHPFWALQKASPSRLGAVGVLGACGSVRSPGVALSALPALMQLGTPEGFAACAV